MRKPECFGIITALLMALGLPIQAAPPPEEDQAFNVAANFFALSVWGRAEAEFADFALKYPNSTRLAEAILYQAEARLQLTNYTGAIDLLNSNLATAGSRADEYQFWLGEAYFRKGEYAAAAEAFAKQIADYPNSLSRLEAAIDEAVARAKLTEWPRVTALLQQPDGVFQSVIRSGVTNELTTRGYLLLSEALFALKNYPASEAELQPLAKLTLPPKLDWERHYLLCRIQLAQHPEVALENTTNLLALADAAAQSTLQAESYAFRADILERLGRFDEAIVAYTNNLASSVAPERRRQALLKIAHLALAQGRLADSAQMLDKFWAQYPQSTNADLALLTLGELRLRQSLAGANTNTLVSLTTNVPASTNYLLQAVELLNTLVQTFPQSSYLGKAQLDLGWCYLQLGKPPQSRLAFQAAVEHLPFSRDQAIAHFKLGDAQFQQDQFAAAFTNYNAIVEQFGTMEEIRTNLFERALYQAVRAAIAETNLDAATKAMTNLLSRFPNSFYADRAVLLTGQSKSRLGDPTSAREIFTDFLKLHHAAPLRSEVELAIARTFEQENLWDGAIHTYESWLQNFTNSEAWPRAEYSCGLACFQAGATTNALRHFTNLVAKFPTNEFTPLAQLWVADYYFSIGRYVDAEANYQLLAHSWPGSKLAYQALMMAGRSAFARQGLKDAEVYFTNLWVDTKCPQSIRAEALFAYGDTLMSMDDANETNKVARYRQAITAFDWVGQYFSNTTPAVAVLAMGEKAICLLQWEQSTHLYEQASNAFYQVIVNPLADNTARSIAKVGLGIVLEKEAEAKTGSERVALLTQALNHYLDVFLGVNGVLRKGEKPNLFWTQKAGLEAARLAASPALHQPKTALAVYQKLMELLPPLRPRLEKNILYVQQQLNLEKH